MKSLLATTSMIFIVGLLLTQARSQETQESPGAADTNAALVKEVRELKQQVNFLMAAHQFDDSDREMLAQRVKNAEQVYLRVKAIYSTGGPNVGATQTNQAEADWRLARARMAVADGQWDKAIEQYGQAREAATTLGDIQRERLSAGVVTIEQVIAASNLAVDVALEKSRAERRMRVMQD